MVRAEVREQLGRASSLAVSAMWAPGIKLRSSGLVTRAFTC